MLSNLVAAAPIIVGIIGLIVARRWAVHHPLSGVSLWIGSGFGVLIGLWLIIHGVANNSTADQVDALEDRYDIIITEYKVTQTPTVWGIDGDHRLCYVEDPDAAELDVRCTEPFAALSDGPLEP